MVYQRFRQLSFFRGHTMPKATLNPDQLARQQRLAKVVGRLTSQGQTQRQIAMELNVPTQYLSDVKTGQRSITEPFARRAAEVCRVKFPWLMHGEGPETAPQFKEVPSATTAGTTLPVLLAPVSGDPATTPGWDGCQIVVAGAPAAIASRAKWPYVLRYDGKDSQTRLVAGDLLLITEPGDVQCEFMIFSHRGKLRMARYKQGAWHPLQGRQKIPANAEAVGAVQGIVWASLRQTGTT
jgi:hypothetical protein